MGKKVMYQAGGIICIIFIAYSMATMLIMVILGAPPADAAGCFEMLNGNKSAGLLRLDILTVFVMPFYGVLVYVIAAAMKDKNRDLMNLTVILFFTGMVLFLATPSAFSMLDLSNKFASAMTDAQKNQLLAAGEAVIASDMWHGTGARIGGLLMQIGAVALSAAMLKSNVFNKTTAVAGIFAHGLDLLHIVFGFFSAATGAILMSIAGTLYLIWFPMIAVRLFLLTKNIKSTGSCEAVGIMAGRNQ